MPHGASSNTRLDQCPRCGDVAAFTVRRTGHVVCLVCGLLNAEGETDPTGAQQPRAAKSGRPWFGRAARR